MERNYLHSIATIALTAAAIALAVPASAQGRRPGGMGGPSNGGRQSMQSSPRQSSPSMNRGYDRPSSSFSHPSSSDRPNVNRGNDRPSSGRPSSGSIDRQSRPASNPGGYGSRPGGDNRGGSSFGNNRSNSVRPDRGNARAIPNGAVNTHGSGIERKDSPIGEINKNGNNPRPGGNGNHGGMGNGNNRPGNGNPGGNWGNNHPGNGRSGGNWGNNYPGNGRSGGNWGNNRPGNGNPGGNWGNNRPGNGNPGGNYGHRPPAGRPHAGINHGGPRPDYNRYRWHSSFRPRGPRDRWYDYYRYNRWSWRAPVIPPHRLWRPRYVWYYRPVIPVGYRVYASAPIITGVLGLEFGTYLDASLNYLYYNGYNIDGYQDNVVYLRDVNLMGYSWPDVMLQYGDGGGLCYAEFAISSTYRDDYRFNSLYNSLCSTYGTPIDSGNGYYSWYGGNQTGYINLNLAYEDGRYYTVMTFGT